MINFRFLEDLDEGVFIQQTVETVLQNEDGKQLMVGNNLVVACLVIFATQCYLSMAYAIMRCLSVRHVRGFCQNE